MIILISKNKLINEFINKLIPELIYKLRNSKSVSDKSVKLFIFKTFEGRKENVHQKAIQESLAESAGISGSQLNCGRFLSYFAISARF